MSEPNSPMRRRRRPVETNNENLSRERNEIELPSESVPIQREKAQPPKLQHSPAKQPIRTKKRDRRVPWLIAIIVIEVLLILLFICATFLYVQNGWVSEGVSISCLFSTPTPTPTLTPTPLPTATPTPIIEYVYITSESTTTPAPVIEYIYITPEPTEIPTPTPIPTATPTPMIEYVYITLEPTNTPMPTNTPTPTVATTHVTDDDIVADTEPSTTVSEVASFDISLFENQEFCCVTVDDIESRAFINVEYYGKVGSAIRPTDGTSIFLSDTFMCPDIYVHDYGRDSELPMMRILIEYGSENWLFADTAIFKIGEKTYTFDGIANENGRVVQSSGDIEEHLTILIGPDNLEFIEEICKGQNDIKLRIKGSKGHEDFDVRTDDIFFSDVKQMYELLIKAGGLHPAFLNRIPSTSMIVR